MANLIATELPVLQIAGGRLRLPTFADVPQIIEYYTINKEHISVWDPAWPPDFLTEPFWMERVATILKEFEDDKSVRLFLFDAATDHQVLGTVGFTNFIRGPLQACFLGYCLAKASEGKGLMTAALKAAIPYVFEKKNIHRITAGYQPENARSAKVLARAGFKIECHAEDYLLINGQWRDNVLTSLINKAWRDLGVN